MMQGQGGKRGKDQRPRKRKKETKTQKQRKAQMKKQQAQALSKAAKKDLLQLMLTGGSVPAVPAEGAVAGASAASATNVAAGPAAGPAAASASEASAAPAAHDAPTTSCVTCNAGCLQRCGCSGGAPAATGSGGSGGGDDGSGGDSDDSDSDDEEQGGCATLHQPAGIVANVDDIDAEKENSDLPDSVMTTYLRKLQEQFQAETTGKENPKLWAASTGRTKWLLPFLRDHDWCLPEYSAKHACEKLGIPCVEEAYYREVKFWFPDVRWGLECMPPCPIAAATAAALSCCREH